MKIIIAGGRDVVNPNFLTLALADAISQDFYITEVVCGMAKGADTLGALWARANNIPIKCFPANWERFGNQAGPIRNKEMAVYADGLLALWDGQSRGTRHMIETMRNMGKILRVWDVTPTKDPG